MRKLYSIVLMAAALLIGTNAWADPVTTRDQLQQAINEAGLKKDVGTVTITLGSDITIPENSCIWLGTNGVDDDVKSIKLELNGFNIKMQSTGTGTPRYMFVVSHGELLVTNSASAKSQLILKGNTHKNSAIFYVYGSYKSSRWTTDADGNYVAQTDESKIINTRNEGYFTHVEIGERVELYADGCNGTGIVIDAIHGSTAPYAYGPKVLQGINYNTNLYDGNYGLAQGVRVDIKGDIDFSNVTTSMSSIKSYGIKLNGNVWNALDTEKRALKTSFGTDAKYFSHYKDNRASHTADTIDAPYIHIYPGAHLKSSNVTTGDTDNSTAVYVAGYGKVRIDGAICEGNTALYASSGAVEVNDATLHSTATAYTTPQSGGSANGGGSTLVLNSRDGYGGGIDITITGDTKITSDAGYAIESRNNTSTDSTKVEGLHIESATIEGGDMGAIIIEPKDDKKSTIVVANITGQVSSTDPSKPVTLEDLVSGEHHTVVVDGVTVVTPGATPAATNWAAIEGNQGEDKDYNWNVAEAAVIGDGTAATKVTLGNLEMNAGTSGNLQSITIKNNATLEANYIMMNDYARIIVEAGGALIVKGANGIYSNKVENIVLETQEGKPAIFILNPAVTFNTHPKATVELTSKSYYEGGKIVYQRFGLPSYTSDVQMEYKDPSSSTTTYIQMWDYSADKWTESWIAVPAATGLNVGVSGPFGCFDLASNNAKNAPMTYLFKGALVGNSDATMAFNSKFNPYANSYMAPIDIKTLVNRLADNYPELSAAVYVYVALANDNYTWLPLAQSDFTGWDVPAVTKIDPMQAYMLYMIPGNTSNATVSYKDNVYDPFITNASNPAPAHRAKAAKKNFLKLNIADESGVVFDNARILEDNQFGEEFDNGYDVNKYMNEKVNLYVMSQDEAWSTLASDDVLNKYIGVNVAQSGVYTISVAHNGLDYALVDLENNQVIDLVEGNTYNFFQEAGKNDARFQVVKVSKVPTALEDVQNDVLSTKFMKDGVLYIIKNGVVYNAQGQIVK